MPYILTGSSMIICPHGGRVQHSPVYATETLMIDGHYVFFHDDKYLIGGCPAGCERIEWFKYYQELIYKGNRYFLTHESQPSCYGSGSGFKGYGLILFFQMKVDTETIKKQFSAKG